MTVILRDVPPTYDWGWFSREDQRMHLQSVDKDHWFFHYKVWLEEKGRKVIEPELGIPAKVLSVLKKEIQVQRGRIEAYWIAFMIKNGWLRCHLRNGLIILRAYPNTPNHFERSIKLSEIIPNEEVARKVTPQDVVLNEEFAMLEIFPRREESSRVHERLEDLLWRG
ncbi:MAG: hypothetical protein HY040_26710 [Planctomycetes bacterium]|nr:hypothetical protein [Planctomycetota bacterium]